MSKRLVSKKILPNGTGYKVYRSYHTGEWITEFYLRGVKHNGASYFTDSQDDAAATGQFWLTGKAPGAEYITLEGGE